MYKNYIFDLYGTLMDIRTDEEAPEVWEAFAAWMRENGMAWSGRSLKRRYARLVSAQMAAPSVFSCPEIDLTPVFAALCRSRRPDAPDKLVWAAGNAFRHFSTRLLEPYPAAKQTLEKLRAAGKRVFLLSNAQRIFTWRELEETGLLPYFDDVFISSDLGCKKPDPAFFRALLDKHGLCTAECVMVGNDGSADIAGADAAGMDAVYLRTAISPADEALPDCRFVFPDGDIAHVQELIRT